MASSLQKLLRASKPGRVQVADVAGTPQLQPTIQSGGRYGVDVQQAPKANKFTDLAEALSTINPALKHFAAAQSIADEKQMLAGYVRYQEDPEATEKELSQFKSSQDVTKQNIRKLINAGKLPDEWNAVRMFGALKAKAAVMVASDYRADVMSGVSEVTDIEGFLGETRKEFLKRGEFDSAVVKEHALAAMMKVDAEFRNTVQKRLQDAEIEEGRENWIKQAEPFLEQALGSGKELNDIPELLEWINSPAGLFSGYKQHAFTHLFKRKLLTGLHTTDSRGHTIYTPGQVSAFLDRLSDWKISDTGAKFGDAEVGSLINAFRYEIKGFSASVENNNVKAKKAHKEAIVAGIFESFIKELEKGEGPIPKEMYFNALRLINKEVPIEMRPEAFTTIASYFKNQNALMANPNATINAAHVSDLYDDLQNGADVAQLGADITSAFRNGYMTIAEMRLAKQELAKRTSFVENVKEKIGYRNTQDSYETAITGWRKMTEGWHERQMEGASFQASWFKLEEVKLTKNFGGKEVDQEIDLETIYLAYGNHNASDLEIFKSHRATIFRRKLEEALLEKYDDIINNDKKSPEEATKETLDAITVISEKVFNAWEKDTHLLIHTEAVAWKNTQQGVSGITKLWDTPTAN